MSTVQISDAGGLSYQNGSIHSLTGVLVQDGINGSEVSPGTYSFNFGTIPDGDYSFSASIGDQLAFAERVTISSDRAINPVASQDSASLTGLATAVLANPAVKLDAERVNVCVRESQPYGFTQTDRIGTVSPQMQFDPE